MANDLLTTLRQNMKEKHIDALYVPTADPHQTEYVGEHYQTRTFLTGFTGSAGTAVVTENDALLWTDGRYFIQAEREIEPAGFSLMKMATPGYPTVIEWLTQHMPEEATLAFNGQLLSQRQYESLETALKSKKIKLVSDDSLLESLWADRPALPKSRVFTHDIEFAGQTVKEKLDALRERMKDVDGTLLSSLNNIGWLFNFRGGDLQHDPIAYAYSLITKDNAILYLDPAKYDKAFSTDLEENGVTLKPYEAIWDDAKSIEGKMILDKATTSRALYEAFGQVEKVDRPEPVFLQKASLLAIEEENTRDAWLEDGVALVRFFRWLEAHVKDGKETEITASDELSELRKKGRHFLKDSFDTISAYADNAAMMHYKAAEETAKTLKPEGLYLIDSGGHYLSGTTDITRTVALGKPTDKERRDYTLVLKSHINLATAVFLYGMTGHYLDVLARQPLWKHHIDYKSGTGHAIGYLGGVHEGPQRISTVHIPVKLEENMVITIEPGIYREGEHGIRLENVYIVKEDGKAGTDRFMRFDCLSFVPFDRSLIDVSLLSDGELTWLNEYHTDVYAKLSPRLSEEEAAWLKKATEALGRS